MRKIVAAAAVALMAITSAPADAARGFRLPRFKPPAFRAPRVAPKAPAVKPAPIGRKGIKESPAQKPTTKPAAEQVGRRGPTGSMGQADDGPGLIEGMAAGAAGAVAGAWFYDAVTGEEEPEQTEGTKELGNQP